MSQFELDTLGEFAVYPGHPVMVGLVIMARFNNLDEASAVYQALDLLHRIKNGKPVEEAIKEVHDDWRAGGHENRVAEGKAQAERFIPRYIEKVKEWIK